eukprot:jgi/Mesen1/6250/ME000323S05383
MHTAARSATAAHEHAREQQQQQAAAKSGIAPSGGHSSGAGGGGGGGGGRGGAGGEKEQKSTVVVKARVDIQLVVLGLYVGSKRDSKLAHMQVQGLWLTYLTRANGIAELMLTVPRLLVKDCRPETGPELRYIIGNADEVESYAASEVQAQAAGGGGGGGGAGLGLGLGLGLPRLAPSSSNCSTSSLASSGG